MGQNEIFFLENEEAVYTGLAQRLERIWGTSLATQGKLASMRK